MKNCFYIELTLLRVANKAFIFIKHSWYSFSGTDLTVIALPTEQETYFLIAL